MQLAYLGLGVTFVGLLALEVLAPGSVSGALAPMLASSLDPAVRLGGLAAVGLATWAVYRWVFQNSGSSSSDSGSSDDDGDGGSTTIINVDDNDTVSASTGGDD
jgi:hypothetical protein